MFKMQKSKVLTNPVDILIDLCPDIQETEEVKWWRNYLNEEVEVDDNNNPLVDRRLPNL
jgi:hypothetical protein